MIHVPLYFFLFIYFAFLIIFIIFSIINIGHIFATASYTITSFVFTIITLAMTLAIFFFTWVLLQSVNWTQLVKIFDTGWFTSVLTF
jgi:hypothetical protein